jgi:hypothetical protein
VQLGTRLTAGHSSSSTNRRLYSHRALAGAARTCSSCRNLRHQQPRQQRPMLVAALRCSSDLYLQCSGAAGVPDTEGSWSSARVGGRTGTSSVTSHVLRRIPPMRLVQMVTGSPTIDRSAAVPTSIPNSCAYYIRSVAQAWTQQRDLCRWALDIRSSALAVVIGDWALAAWLSRCMQLGTRRGYGQLATGSLSRCICCVAFAVGICSFTRVVGTCSRPLQLGA